jgi:two-component system, OmpR family, sensor histidine kinase VicK
MMMMMATMTDRPRPDAAQVQPPAASGSASDPGRPEGPGDARSARAWRVIVGAIVGLVLGIALASSVAIAITLIVGEVAERAIEHDVNLEDEGDDVLATVLDVRHYHRNLLFGGPSRDDMESFDGALAALHEELDELGEIVIESTDLATAQELRGMVDAYEASYRPAIELWNTDQAAFDEASDHGLLQLEDIQTEAVKLEERGEELAEAAFRSINETTTTATLILVAVLVGVGAAGVALSVAAVRVLREQRDLYAAQRESAAQLEQALRTRTDFIADASHELRTPLTVLRGNAEVGLAASSPDCGHEPILREIVAESERMTRLVEDLLFLARYDAGALPLEERLIDIEPWMAEVAARAEVLARQRGARLSASTAVAGRALLDAERVQQAILVLIDNAAKFSPPGAPVALSAITSGAKLRIVVEDRGPGIPADILPYIFERFYRADRTRGRRQGGAGLGLSIARAIVDAHGGRIEAVRRPGGGTSMRIEIPIREVAAVVEGRPARLELGTRSARPSPISQLSGPRPPTRPA